MRGPAVALLMLLLAACAPPAGGPRTSWRGDRAEVFLEYRGRALSVCALGDFNDWQPERGRFERVSPEHWTLRLTLPPGRYAYLLRVEKEDGLHLDTDPRAAGQMRDGQGRRLSVLDLAAAGGDIPPESRDRR